MKKIIILSVVFFFSFSLVFAQNETKVNLLTQSEAKLKEEINELEKELNHKKEELRAIQEELKKFEGVDVNNRVKENFYDDFGDKTDVIWKRNDMYNVATFTDEGKTKKAYYDFNSQLIGTTWYVTFADLPEKAQQNIEEKYNEYEIGKVIYYDDNESVDVDFFIFETQFKHEDNFFAELTKESDHIILKVGTGGDIDFFKKIK